MVHDQEIKQIEEALEKICAHRLFVSSPTHTRLLKYLIEKAFAKEELNEVTIGSDLYGIDYSTDSNNGTVRSYMYKLRKKINEYYSETQHEDSIVFEIEKGQYNLKFVSQSKKQYTNKEKVLTIKVPVYRLAISSILLGSVVLFTLIVKHQSDLPGAIWKPFFEKEAQNVVVISDQFVVNEKFENGEEHAVLYKDICNLNDFLKYTEKNPEKDLKITDYTLMSKMAPFAIKSLTQWFFSNHCDFSLKLESKLTYEDIRDNNIIFIGQHKTMNLSKSLFLKNSKVFSTFEDGFKCTTNGAEKIFNTKFSQDENVEYAMVSFTSLSPGRAALYFTSNNDIGVMATLRKFTDKEWQKAFFKQISKNSYFNALFEVSGIQRNDIDCKLVEIEELKQ